jgi:trehalose/maltose hydrolase-like predicted phosphorylase
MGPDEFHDGYPDRPGQGIDNSAYVNLMVAWTLARAREVKQLLDRHHGEELCQSLNLTGAEFENWDHIGRRLRVPFLPNGMIEQFEGHGRLAELDLDAYRARHGDLRRLGFILLAENDNTNRYQVSKQADVLMLLYLFTAEELTALIHHLGYGFDPAIIPAMVDHYLARSAEGSTLSRIADSWVLSRTNRRRSWQTLREALAADSETKGSTSREGIHLGAIAGTLDILQRCYTGLDTHDNVLWLNPLLPDELRRLQFDIRYRGHWITLRFDHFQMSVESHPGEAPPATLAVRETFYQLAPGDTITRPTPIARHAAQPV